MEEKLRDGSRPFRWEDLSAEDLRKAEATFMAAGHIEEVMRARHDPETAVRLLETAAQYLREGLPMPRPLAGFLADAFEAAAQAETNEDGTLPLAQARAQALARALGLMPESANRPIKAGRKVIGPMVFRLLIETPREPNRRPSQNEAIRIVAKREGLSPATVKRRFLEWREREGREAWTIYTGRADS